MDDMTRTSIIEGVSCMCKAAHADAKEKGLFERYANLSFQQKREMLAYRVEDEAIEAAHAADLFSDYAEELADVVITACSAAEEVHVDLAEAVVRKMKINEQRERYHGKPVMDT